MKNKGMIKTTLIVIVVIIFGALIYFLISSGTSEKGITRDFSSKTVMPGQTFNVKYNIQLNKDSYSYLFEDNIPLEFKILSGNCFPNTQNQIKIVEFQNVKSNVLECSLEAPLTPGEYSFSGIYFIDGGLQTEISGKIILKVVSK